MGDSYHKCGVTWKYGGVSEPDYNFFRVNRQHIPSGQLTTIDILVMRDGADIVYRLLNHWNQQPDWKYWIA